MTRMIALYGHPFAAFAWKALIAAYERGVPFDFRVADPEHPEHAARLALLSPTGQFPALLDGDVEVTGSNAVVHYLDRIGDAPPLVPLAGEAAVRVREMADVFDDYVAQPMQAIVADALRPEGERDPTGVARARDTLERSYAWLDRRLPAHGWAADARFTLADVAAAPALFYADWTHPIPPERATLRAYRARLLAHPAVARVVDEARPFRPFFPLGAPDRDRGRAAGLYPGRPRAYLPLMPMAPPPDFDTLTIADIARLADADRLPPVERWHPDHCGDSEMRIARDGTWFHQGSPIGRAAMVKAFSRILRREPDGGYVLVTPVEKLDIAVEDAPFVAVEMKRDGEGRDATLAFRLNTGDLVTASAEHPLRFVETEDGPHPYLHVRGAIGNGLEALVTRAIYYDLAEIALAGDDSAPGVWSAGAFFPLSA